MEYIVGDTLNKFIKTEVYLKESVIKNFTKQLVDAISYMHSKFVMHRFVYKTNYFKLF